MSASKLISQILIALWLSAVCFAQSAATGDLHVTVKDAKASLITNATVTVRDTEKGFERATAVNTDGQYDILALPPGTYTVTAQAQGFAKATVKDVRITVGQLAELPVELAIAGTQETVSVSATAELIETERTSSTNTIEQRRIENLPINGRNYINFALTDSRLARDDAPSIGAAPTSGLNMSGQRGRANLVNVDGADSVDNSTNGVRSTISQEGVQEFQIQTNGYAAEYGRASGGVVNIVTKSGTNDYHGSVYGYLRNRSFQAVNPFSTVKDPAYTRVQPGVAFGGPIKNDKTFFFFSYEGTWRQETGFSSIGADNFGLQPFDATRIFNPAAPPGTFTIQATSEQANFLAPFVTAGAAPLNVQFYTFLVGASSGIALDGTQPQTFALLPFAPAGSGRQQFPTSCNVGTPAIICGGLPASFVNLKSLQGNFPVSEHTDLYSLRVDHNFTATNRLTVRGAASPSDLTGIQVQAQGPQNFGQNAFSRTSTQNYHDWSIAAQDQWVLGGNKINELRFQYARRGLLYSFSRGAGGSDVAVNIPGFAFFGREPFSFVNRSEKRYQFTDNFSLSKGAHNFKFGADVNYLPITADFTVNFGGIYNFAAQSVATGTPALSPVQAYGAGIPSNFIQGVGGPHDAFSNKTLGLFAQDSWRIKPGLTLNYGVRYDVEFTPTFKATNATASFGQQFLGITQGIPRDYNNFAPRIGLAWDPRRDGKSVFRASYGIFYDHPLLGLAFDSDVADGSQAPQFVLFGGSPCTGIVTPTNPPNPLKLNAANVFQGIAGDPTCTPVGLTQALNYLPGEQRFNPAPNAPSVFVNQQYLQAGVPLAVQPFGFPTASNFQYASSQQVNFAFEQDLGHDLALSVEYSFNGGHHLNRPINANPVRPDLLVNNYNVAVAAGAATPGDSIGPLTVGSGNPPCGVNPNPGPLQGQPWVSAALVSFFRPSGLNPSLANFLSSPAVGAGACVTLANQVLGAVGLNAACDPATLTGCVPFSDMPANFSNGNSAYHALTANLRKRFGQHYEFLGSYTWSHAIDDSTDLQSPLAPQDNYNPKAERSNSLFDQRHRFVFSGVYQSGGLGGTGFVRKFFSNWTLAPLIEVVSGRPFNLIVGGDRNFDFGTTTDRPVVVPATAPQNACGDDATASKHSPTGFLQPACFLSGTLVGNLGRNAGTKPYNLFTDLGVAKDIQLGERVALQGRMDIFNFINRFNVADVNPLWDSGQKPTASFDPRQLQFALKIKW